MKYYRCIREMEEVNGNSDTDTNMFISYALGKETTNNSFCPYYFGNGGWWTDSYFNKYNFKPNWIYQSNDDGITIIDDAKVVHDLEPIKEYFMEINTDLNAETEELIKRKRTRGCNVKVKPLMDMVGNGILYRVECRAITRNGRGFSSTWDEDTDVYESIIRCFKRLRTCSLNGYYSKIKDVLEIQKNERTRKHT